MPKVSGRINMEGLKPAVIKILILILLIGFFCGFGYWFWHRHDYKKEIIFMDKYHGPVVNVSGKVIFPEYISGEITIIASRRRNGPPDIATAVIPFPGEYCFRVPKDFGDIYIRAGNSVMRQGPRRNAPAYYGIHSNYHLRVGSFDIKGIDLIIKTRPFILMDFYPGPTSTISGKVIFPDYEGDRIVISVSTKNNIPTYVALKIIPHPGEYRLKVPRNFGDIYLQAKSFKLNQDTPLNKSIGKYKQNPLKVGRYDIQGIDIVF
jgi:hypothetical protein